jgi:Fe-S oxidoreductase
MVLNRMVITEPRKKISFGAEGVYEEPRSILERIKGVELREMERTREYAYCCGAGGGAKEAFPEFAIKAARERMDEAKATGAEALVTSCPWCVRNFKDALDESGENMQVYDMVDMVRMGMGIA